MSGCACVCNHLAEGEIKCKNINIFEAQTHTHTHTRIGAYIHMYIQR